MDFAHLDDIEAGGGERVRAAGRHLQDTRTWRAPAAMLLVQLPMQAVCSSRKWDTHATARVHVAFAAAAWIFACVPFAMLIYIRSTRTAMLVFPVLSHLLALSLLFLTANFAILSSDSVPGILGVLSGCVLLAVVVSLMTLGYTTTALRVGPGWLLHRIRAHRG